MLLINPDQDLNSLEHVFAEHTLLVAKPDQLVKRRGKLGLIQLKVTFDQVTEWIKKKFVDVNYKLEMLLII